MFPAARIGDPASHDMTAPSGVIGVPTTPPGGGVVMIEGMPAAHATCTVACSGTTSAGMAHSPPGAGTPPPPIITGSATVFIHGWPAARWAPSGDTTACGALLGDPKGPATRTVFIGGASVASELWRKAARRRQRKRHLALGREKAAQMPDGETRKRLIAATERFEFNMHGAEMAQLAQHVYRPKPGEPLKPTPTGWKNISNDPNRLKELGLSQDDLQVPLSNYRAQVYEPDPSVFGDDMKPTLAFKGTDPGSGEDWKNNVDQGVDKDSLYYRQAVGAGTRILEAQADVEITGHSLGGGLASAASRASGKPAMLDGGLSVNLVTVTSHRSLLHKASGAFGATIEHVKLLIDRGADLELPDTLGETPLLSAIFTMQPSRGILLVDRGAKVNVYTVRGVTPALAVQSAIDRQQPGSPMRLQFEQLRDRMITRGAKFPPDRPDKVRAWMKTQGMEVAE